MNIFTVCVIGVTVCLLTVLIRQQKPEMSVLLIIAGTVMISTVIISWIAPVISKLSSLAGKYQLNDELAVLIKAVGICMVTQSACDTCADASCGSLAKKIEIAGKIAVLIIVFPLFEKLLELAVNIMDG